MKVRPTLIAGFLTLIGIAALAATGDAADYDPPRTSSSSIRTRADVKAQVREARANGELRAAGDAELPVVARVPSTWGRSRAEVTAEVLAARAHGELIPAGEGRPLGVEAIVATRRSPQTFADSVRKLRAAQ